MLGAQGDMLAAQGDHRNREGDATARVAIPASPSPCGCQIGMWRAARSSRAAKRPAERKVVSTGDDAADKAHLVLKRDA